MEGADGRFNVGVVAGSVGRTGAIRRGQLSGPYAAGAGVRAGAGRMLGAAVPVGGFALSVGSSGR